MSSVEAVSPPPEVCGVSLSEPRAGAEGQWSGRTVRVLDGGASPRAMLYRLGRAVQSGLSSLWDRAVYLLSPVRSQRAQAQVRQGLQATDQALGELLAALRPGDRGAICADAVRAAIGALQVAAAPVLRHAADPADTFAALLRARLPLALEKLDLAQLEGIQSGVQACSRPGQPDLPRLALVGEALKRAITPRAQRMDLLIEAARYLIAAPLLEAAPASEREAAHLMEDLYATAAGLMRPHGLPADDRRVQRNLVLQGLNAHLRADPGEKRARGERLAQALALLPGQELQALREAAAQARSGTRPVTDVAALLERQAGLRAERLEARFLQDLQALQPGPGSRDPATVARRALSACRTLDALHAHASLFGSRVSRDVEIAAQAFAERLRDGLDGVGLEGLADAELGQLSQALRAHGGPMEPVSREIALRQAAAVRSVDASLVAVADADGPGGLLRSLGDLHDRLAQVIHIHEQLGTRIGLAGEPAFVQGLLEGAVGRCDDVAQVQLRTLCGGPAGERLVAALSGTGQALSRLPAQRERESSARFGLGEAGRRAEQVSATVRALGQVVGGEAGGAGDAPVPAAAPGAEAPLQAAIAQAWGPADVVPAHSGQFDAAACDIFRANLDEMRQQPSAVSRLEPRLTDDLRKDLTRFDYAVQVPGELPQPLIDREMAEDDAVQVRKAADRLAAASGGDLPSVLRLGRFAHQGLLAGVEKVLLSASSPLFLDGQRLCGKLSAEAAKIDFTVEADGAGGWRVKVDYRFNPELFSAVTIDAQGYPVIGGEPIPLDPARSFVKVSAQVVITAGGEARLAGPIDYGYALRRSA